MTRALKKRGFSVSRSVTNTLLIQTPVAKRITEELEKQDVSVVNADFFPFIKVKGFRIALRDAKTNRLFLQKFDAALACIEAQKLLRSKEVL